MSVGRGPPRSSPIDIESLSRAAYLLDVYAEADAAYRRFRTTRRPSELLNSAAILCLGLAQLDTDDAVWQAFFDLPNVPTESRDEVWTALDSIDSLVGLEIEILHERRPNVPFEESEGNLLWDAAAAVNDFRRWPDEVAVGRLREIVGTARRSACARATWPRSYVPQRRSRSIERGLRVAGGVGLAGVNAGAAIAGLPWTEAAASIITGIEIAAPAI